MPKRNYTTAFLPPSPPLSTLGYYTKKQMKQFKANAQKFANFGSGTMTGTRTSGNSGQGVTTQHDVTQQYRKKRMPRRKRRAWKKFVKKVHAVADTGIGLRTVLFNELAFLALPPSGQQWGSVLLYGNGGSDTGNENGCEDLQRIFNNDPEWGNTQRAYFKSACLDITMVNNLPAEPVADTVYTMEVDVYKVYFRQVEDDLPNLTSVLSFSTGEVGTISGGGSDITMNTRGATPFALGQFLRRSGMTIINKKKFLIAGGQAATYQHRDPKNRWVAGSDVARVNNEMCLKRTTVGFFIVAKAVDPTAENTLSVRNTRTYTYKVDKKEVAEIKNQSLP